MLAIVVFFAAFLLTAVPFVLDTDNFLVVAACVIGCFSCSLLFMRLLIGDLGAVKWILLASAGGLGIAVGEQWYLVVFLTGGTVVCSFLINRMIGDFAPLVRMPER